MISPLTVVRWLTGAIRSMGPAWVVYQRVKGPASVRTMMVAVALELGQDSAQLPFTVDQQVAEALPAWRSHVWISIGGDE